MWASAGEQSPGTSGLDIWGQQHPANRHPPGMGIIGSATWCNMCRMFIDVRANPF